MMLALPMTTDEILERLSHLSGEAGLDYLRRHHTFKVTRRGIRASVLRYLSLDVRVESLHPHGLVTHPTFTAWLIANKSLLGLGDEKEGK